MGFFDKLKQGLERTKIAFNFKKIEDGVFDSLEEELIEADVGLETSEKIIGELREKVKKDKIIEVDDVKKELKNELINEFSGLDSRLDIENKPAVILMIGVNGAGKTTSIGKIANKYIKDGKRVLVAAGDTFRAGAVEQLEEWANRANATLVKGKLEQDPASVIFDACKKAKEENYDILICDTAGRLQNKKNLMDELKKIKKIIDRELPDSSKETILVLDASIGQNAISQVKAFKECTGITGIAVTKIDGTAKGGIIIRLASEYKIPIKFIGVGEKIDDMEQFSAEDFVNAIIK